MPSFVVDASATLPWCFKDESTAWTESLLRSLRLGDRLHVPAHWPAEVSNGLLVALRRKRIEPGRPEHFWDELSVLPMKVEPPLFPEQAKLVLSLSQKHGLTFYDAAYLELARRKGLSLATLDSALVRAASMEGVGLM